MSGSEKCQTLAFQARVQPTLNHLMKQLVVLDKLVKHDSEHVEETGERFLNESRVMWVEYEQLRGKIHALWKTMSKRPTTDKEMHEHILFIQKDAEPLLRDLFQALEVVGVETLGINSNLTPTVSRQMARGHRQWR